VTGAIYGIRRELIDPLPEDMILDDMYIPLKTVLKGKRVVFETGARAFDRVSETSRQEFVRKVRTLAGNFQIFFRLPRIFDPFISSVAFQIFFHKWLRLMVPYALIAAFVSNAVLASKNLSFLVLFIGQFDFYGLALVGYLMERAGVKMKGRARMMLVPYEFCVMNLAAVVGLVVYLTQPGDVRWKR
jgi:cellulose synthase/poly-beta-1,6-N-acetylglucosamine synthase-like glycosyltransferase